MKPAPIDPPEIHDALWSHTPKGQMAWDIGANCGQTLALLASLFDFVVAFEPAEECMPYLHSWQERDDVDVLPYAISDHSGQVTLAALPDKIDTGQLVTPGTHGMEWAPDVPGAVARTVPCFSIDSLLTGAHGFSLPKPDFIKLDVEGHEGKVLDGAKKMIKTHHPQWLIEFHTPQLHDTIVRQLGRAGYAVQTVRHPHYAKDSPMYFQHGWVKALPK